MRTQFSMKLKGGVNKLIELPPVTDEEIVIALRLLNLLIHYALLWNQELFPLLIFRVVNFNMTHGMSPQMPSAIALYGAISNRIGSSVTEAYRYGEVALALQQTIGINATWAYITVVNHSSSFLFNKKLSDCLKPLRSGWDSGLKEGESLLCLEMSFYFLVLSTGTPMFNRGCCSRNDLR